MDGMRETINARNLSLILFMLKKSKKEPKSAQVSIFKILVALVTIVVIPISIDAFFHLGIFDKLLGRQSQEDLLKELLNEIKKEDLKLDTDRGIDCVSDIRSFTWNKKGFTLIADLYDGCDVKYFTSNKTISEQGSAAFLIYPLWDADEKNTHYFFDYYSGSNFKNRISLFKSLDGYLKYRIYNLDGTIYDVSLDVRDWKFGEWAIIAWSFNEKDGELLLHFNNFKTGKNFIKTESFKKLDLEIIDVTMYVGSDIEGKNQADAVISKVPDWVITQRGITIPGAGLELGRYL